MAEGIEVINNPAKGRYEATVDGHLAVLTYELQGRTITFLHTGVPGELEGRGVGSMLAKTALDEAQAAGLSVVPLCPFVAAYIRRHKDEYLALVDARHRAALSED